MWWGINCASCVDASQVYYIIIVGIIQKDSFYCFVSTYTYVKFKDLGIFSFIDTFVYIMPVVVL